MLGKPYLEDCIERKGSQLSSKQLSSSDSFDNRIFPLRPGRLSEFSHRELSHLSKEALVLMSVVLFHVSLNESRIAVATAVILVEFSSTWNNKNITKPS